MTRSLAELANRLVDLRVERVVMEATSDYWKPVFYLLEAHGLDPWLVNARDVRHLPGRPKTDVLDAVWLCKVAERQMLRPSFVPPRPIRVLRDLTRYRIDLVAARTAEKSRVEKLLEDAGIKLSVVASDIFGVSGRAMLAALIAGQRDPAVLADLARARMRAKISLLEEAFAGLPTGAFAEHHRFLLQRMLGRIDAIDADIAILDAEIEAHLAPFDQAVQRLDEIPGIGPVAAAIIIAEVGVDMTRFPTAGHLCSWAKFSPGIKSSAGKSKGSGSTGHGDRYLARVLGSRDDAARRRPSSRWAAPCWSSSGTSCPNRTSPSTTLAPITTPARSTPTPGNATTSDSSRPSDTESPSSPQPEQLNSRPTQATQAPRPLGSVHFRTRRFR
jgi:transposase